MRMIMYSKLERMGRNASHLEGLRKTTKKLMKGSCPTHFVWVPIENKSDELSNYQCANVLS
jgi:hypothetical protein